MLVPNFTARFFNRMFKQPGPVARYLMPFVTVGWALGLQVAVSQFVPKKVDFPYAFFYLFAILATAWFGGYVPGVVSVVVATIALPLIAPPDFHLTSIDPSRLVFSLGLSVLISLVAQSQRKMRGVLEQADTLLDLTNAELGLIKAEIDDPALMATVELVKVVDDLRLEVAQYAHIEDELRQSGERVDMALDAAGIGVWGVNLATGELKRSRRHNAIFGYDASDSCAGLFDRVIPEDLAAAKQSFLSAVETRGACEFECRIRHPQGGIRWIWAKGKAIVDETGEARSVLGSACDITVRKSAEEELKTRLARLNLLEQIATHNDLQQACDDLRQTQQTGMQHDLQALGQMTDATPPPLRILSVDDDPVLIKCLCDALEADGHVVVTAHGGQDGIDTFREAERSGQPFGVVITDLSMPNVDGREVASAIKAASPSTPVILLTGWGQGLVTEGDIPPYVDRVLNKPPRLWELRAALADLAGRSVTTSVAAHEEDAVATEQAS
jgi:PAS domain S-box-containing protein